MSKEQEPIFDLTKRIEEYLYKEHENFLQRQKRFYEETSAMFNGAVKRYCKDKEISEQDFIKEFFKQ